MINFLELPDAVKAINAEKTIAPYILAGEWAASASWSCPESLFGDAFFPEIIEDLKNNGAIFDMKGAYEHGRKILLKRRESITPEEKDWILENYNEGSTE